MCLLLTQPLFALFTYVPFICQRLSSGGKTTSFAERNVTELRDVFGGQKKKKKKISGKIYDEVNINFN